MVVRTFCRIDLPHDAVKLKLGDLWTLEGVGREWVTNDVLLCSLLEALNELVVDAFLDVDARSGTAALAVVEENTKVDPGDGIVNVCIVEDNVRALATELEGDLLQVGAGSGLHDLATNNGGASEGNLVDVHVCRDGGTGDLTESREDVDDTCWETGLLDEVCGVESGKRGLLGGLEDNNVTGCESWTDLPCPHEEWEVPWDDLTANTNLRV